MNSDFLVHDIKHFLKTMEIALETDLVSSDNKAKMLV